MNRSVIARVSSLLLPGLIGLGFVLFVLGGLGFGWIFLSNWRILSSRQVPVQVAVPGGERVVGLGVPPPLIPNILLPSAGSAPADGGGKPALSLSLLPDWTDRNRINVLLLGIDQRDNEPIDSSRSDTLMIVSIDPIAKSVVMVSLPRDLWVGIPGYGEQRINVAHALGGPKLAMSTVTANFGVRLNHYARINFRGFEQMIDTLGGVFIDVERPVKDDEYPTEDYGVRRLYIAPGPQYMDGTLALQYARSRHGENDFARARRQQRVLVAARERALSAGVLLRAPELIPLALQVISTDIEPLDLIKLAKLSSEIRFDKITNLVIDGNYATSFMTEQGAAVLLPDRGAIQGAINQALARAAAPTPTPLPPPPTATIPAKPTVEAEPTRAPAPTGPIRVEVLNGSGVDGLALQTGNWLKTRGYFITNVDKAQRTPETTIAALPGREAAATALAGLLNLPTSAIQMTPATAGAPDVRIVIGQGFQPPR